MVWREKCGLHKHDKHSLKSCKERNDSETSHKGRDRAYEVTLMFRGLNSAFYPKGSQILTAHFDLDPEMPGESSNSIYMPHPRLISSNFPKCHFSVLCYSKA